MSLLIWKAALNLTGGFTLHMRYTPGIFHTYSVYFRLGAVAIVDLFVAYRAIASALGIPTGVEP